MNDMSQVITPKSDQWNADDFQAGAKTFTIRGVQIRGGQEQPVQISMEGTDKFYRPCKSMSRILVHCWGADATAYVGRSLTLYTDPTVKWGGMQVGGIRISHMSHITAKQVVNLTATKGQRKPHVVMPLVMGQQQEKPAEQQRRKSTSDWYAEIDALPDAAAVAVWLADNEGLKNHSNQAARDIYARAQARGAALLTAGDDFGDPKPDDDGFVGDDDVFPGDR